jgi:hypothetical protein
MPRTSCSSDRTCALRWTASVAPRRRAVRTVVLLPPTSSPTSTARARSRSSTSRAPTAHPTGEEARMTEASRTIRIGSSNGLHARPAKLFAQAAKDSGIR